jgi:electron transport complex protein RnfB
MAQRAADKLAHLEQHSRIDDPAALERKRAVVEAALARVRAGKANASRDT